MNLIVVLHTGQKIEFPDADKIQCAKEDPYLYILNDDYKPVAKIKRVYIRELVQA